jgi:CRP-like cAMP-binding protein
MTVTIRNQSLIFPYEKELNHLHSDVSRVSFFNQGEVIPQKSDRLWLLKKGVVKTLTWNEAGKTIVLGYWGKGELIGSLLSKVDPYEAQCLSLVEAISIPWKNCHYLFKEISYCVRQTDELLRIIRTEKMYHRLAQLLIWLGQKFGSQVSLGILINLRLTHQELADILGSTRVTVTRLLNQLEQKEIIIRPQRFSIIIKDIKLLEDEN